ncbi:MAG: hydrogenase nickel incorporation protein HypB [Terriglobales bacterium]
MEVKVVRKVLAMNDQMAAENRRLFAEKGLLVLNIMSSPGSGKTTTLQKTLARLLPSTPTGVIVGDVCTTNDADRLAKTGAPVVQITTGDFGGTCHLAAHVVREAAAGIDLDAIDLLIIENIGNLICPAAYDIGEDLRGVVLSVTEGEDKPLKYPVIFRAANFVLLNKIDLLPHLTFDKKRVIANIRAVNPDIPILEISAVTEQGLDSWISWIKARMQEKREQLAASHTTA